VTVRDAHGAPATIPFWLGEAPGRSIELSAELSEFRQELCQRAQQPTTAIGWLIEECSASEWGAQQAVEYVTAQHAAIGLVPSQQKVVFERFFDESGGMQLVVHAPFGARINRAWGLALRKCFCRNFDFELQASADDNGIVLSIGPQHSFPIDALFGMLNARNAEGILVQALLAAPMFLVRWRWNTTRALTVLRQRGGKKVPPQLQRFRADDLLAAVFPMQTACFEHRTGDLEVPDHPLVRQTVYDCLHEAMDLPRWLELLTAITDGKVELIARDTREPSPFSYQLLNANPYAFLDDAPLEERRTRAVTERRLVRADDVRDLGRLDAEAIAQVRREAWPLVRDAEELHDALLTLGAWPVSYDDLDWAGYFDQLVAAGRATASLRDDGPILWVAAEQWSAVQAAFPDARPSPHVDLPEALSTSPNADEAIALLVRGRLDVSGPTDADRVAGELGLSIDAVQVALARLEGEGVAFRGSFTGEHQVEEWCERRLLARIHRLTLGGLRRQIEPVPPEAYLRFLLRHQRIDVEQRPLGPGGVRQMLELLQGFDAPAGSWELDLLPARLANYEPEWLDELFQTGEAIWGRLQVQAKNGERPRGSNLTRVVPMAVMRRTDLAWLLPADRTAPTQPPRGDAGSVYEALCAQGALFFDDLLAITGLLPAQLEQALGELSALGIVTADSFAPIRSSAARKHSSSRRMGLSRTQRGRARSRQVGRWSRFPPFVQQPSDNDRLAHWAWQLLQRYGVMFRDLLARETSAPPWHQLVRVYRRLEARGEIRGGRFVAGVGGEQFALADAVAPLREARDRPAELVYCTLSAADPLNLVGIITPGGRVPATRANRVLFLDGRPIAARESGMVRWLVEIDLDRQRQAERLLRRPDGPHREACEGAAEPDDSVASDNLIQVATSPSRPAKSARQSKVKHDSKRRRPGPILPPAFRF
jgi:ATP-dependent Lhr-like helicase